MGNNYKSWDEIYRNYQPNELGWELGKPRPILVEFLEKGFVKKNMALDLCCGLGTNTIYLAEQGFAVTGIDVSPTAIDFAKKRAKEAKVQPNFMVGNFIKLPFGDRKFDFVFDMGCFHHVEIYDRPMFIKGVYRVLKEGGGYMLTCFSHRNGKAWNHFTQNQLVDLLSGLFELGEFRDYSSLEGDGVTRYFYTVLMNRKK